MICLCTGNSKTQGGWTRRSDELWVCGRCRLPTRGFLESFMARKNEEQPIGEGTHLNLLRYGPLHHTLLTNTELLDRRDMLLREDWELVQTHVMAYRWTPEVVVGESGKRARVWVWKEDADA